MSNVSQVDRYIRNGGGYFVSKLRNMGYDVELKQLKEVLLYLSEFSVSDLSEKLEKYNFPLTREGVHKYGEALYFDGYFVDREGKLNKTPQSEKAIEKIEAQFAMYDEPTF